MSSQKNQAPVEEAADTQREVFSKSVSRQALLDFYSKHDPSKTDKAVDEILVAYKGNAAGLIKGLREKYGSSIALGSIVHRGGQAMEEKQPEADEILPFGETEHALEQVDATLDIEGEKSDQSEDFDAGPAGLRTRKVIQFGTNAIQSGLGMKVESSPPVVTFVSEEGQAYAAGVKVGDVITAVALHQNNYKSPT
jgi:hypothetical protein